MSGAFDEQLNGAEPAFAPGKEPVIVKATPYVWRDPRSIPRRPWIYGRQIMRGQVGAKFAPGAAGKTTHEVGTCLALATGRDFLGHRVWDGPKRVWLWNLEDSGEELARSIQAACKHWDITEADLGGRLFVDSAIDGAMLKLATQTAMNGLVINEPLVDALVAEMIDRQIDYLSVDPFVSSHGVEENDNGAIDAVVKKWAYIATKTRSAINLTHHVRKTIGEVSSADARGASSLVAACRSALVLNRMTVEQAKGWDIPGEERRRYFRVYDDKNNRAPPEEASDWFFLKSVDLGNGDEEGFAPSDSMGVAEPWSPPDAFAGVTVDDLLKVQRLIHERGNVRQNSQAARWAGKIVAEVLSLDTGHPADRKKINSMLRMWVINGALVEVEYPDKNGDLRKFIEVGNWANNSGSAPSKEQVRTGAEGADSSRTRTSAPPIYRGAGVVVREEDRTPARTGAGAGNGAAPARVIFGPDSVDGDGKYIGGRQ